MGESSGVLARLRRPRPLLRAAVELVNALNGVRPLGRKGYKTIAVFWFGWPTSEVPALYLTASVLDAVRRGRRGDFAGSRGKVALALTAAAWAALAVIYRRNVTTPGPVLNAALRHGLGDDYAATVRVSGAADRDNEIYPLLEESLEVDMSGLTEDEVARLVTVVSRAVDQVCTVGRTLKSGTTVNFEVVDESLARRERG